MDKLQAQELLHILRELADSHRDAVQVAATSLELQRQSLKIMQTNSNANMAFHLEMTEALKDNE